MFYFAAHLHQKTEDLVPPAHQNESMVGNGYVNNQMVACDRGPQDVPRQFLRWWQPAGTDPFTFSTSVVRTRIACKNAI